MPPCDRFQAHFLPSAPWFLRIPPLHLPSEAGAHGTELVLGVFFLEPHSKMRSLCVVAGACPRDRATCVASRLGDGAAALATS